MINTDREYVEVEIARLEQQWRDAQERYGMTGSRSTERRMARLSALIRALNRALNDMDEEDDRK